MTLKRKTPLRPKPVPGILRTAHLPKVASGKSQRKQLKSKQRHPTKGEKELWSRMAALGCIACRLDGRANLWVSIHHIDGRTKPGCHKKVLPLCAGHHQDGTGNDKSMIAVHPFKAQFEERYGRQMELLAHVHRLLGDA